MASRRRTAAGAAPRAPALRSSALRVLAFGVLALVPAACCPVATPPPTAFVATLTPLGQGRARARLADGRELTLVGLNDAPRGRVYVTGALLPDGSVRVDSVEPAAGTGAAAGPGHPGGTRTHP